MDRPGERTIGLDRRRAGADPEEIHPGRSTRRGDPPPENMTGADPERIAGADPERIAGADPGELGRPWPGMSKYCTNICMDILRRLEAF